MTTFQHQCAKNKVICLMLLGEPCRTWVGKSVIITFSSQNIVFQYQLFLSSYKNIFHTNLCLFITEKQTKTLRDGYSQHFKLIVL